MNRQVAGPPNATRFAYFMSHFRAAARRNTKNLELFTFAVLRNPSTLRVALSTLDRGIKLLKSHRIYRFACAAEQIF